LLEDAICVMYFIEIECKVNIEWKELRSKCVVRLLMVTKAVDILLDFLYLSFWFGRVFDLFHILI
jgi:hypothetical protein